MLQRFFNPSTIYARRAQRCLDDARMAALEHECAAEHHLALARMYRERVARLEKELSPAQEPSVILDPSLPPRVAPLRRSDSATQQPYLAQNAAAAS